VAPRPSENSDKALLVLCSPSSFLLLEPCGIGLLACPSLGGAGFSPSIRAQLGVLWWDKALPCPSERSSDCFGGQASACPSERSSDNFRRILRSLPVPPGARVTPAPPLKNVFSALCLCVSASLRGTHTPFSPQLRRQRLLQYQESLYLPRAQ